MQSRHDLRALADRCSNPLGRAGANVSNRKYARPGRFQLPMGRPGVRARQHKPSRIERHVGPGKPIGIWFSADEQEEVAHIAADFFSRRSVSPADRLHDAVATFEAGDFGTQQHFHVGEPADAIDQIAGHACGQIRAADDEPDLGGLTGQIDGCLARRIASAH